MTTQTEILPLAAGEFLEWWEYGENAIDICAAVLDHDGDVQDLVREVAREGDIIVDADDAMKRLHKLMDRTLTEYADNLAEAIDAGDEEDIVCALGRVEDARLHELAAYLKAQGHEVDAIDRLNDALAEVIEKTRSRVLGWSSYAGVVLRENQG